jgi:hypothetical protein
VRRTIALAAATAAVLLGAGGVAAVAAPTTKPAAPYSPQQVVVQASEPVGPGSGNTVSVVAYCPAGKIASGGVAQVPSDQDPAVSWALQATIPVTEGLPTATGWMAQARRHGGESTNSGSLTIRFLCVNP